MKHSWAALLWILIPTVATADDAAETYRRDVRPVLQRRCFSCHGALQQKAGLRLDTARAIRRGGDSGSAVVPGDAAASLLIERVTETDPALRMPPEGEPLTVDEITALRAWIGAGAPQPEGELPQKDPREHWAYRPPIRPALPSESASEPNPVDAFLEAARRMRGVRAGPAVSRDLWLRRVTLDLTGLPPTPEELQAFRDDDSPGAWEAVVDRLLASPAHGERWARHWMDVWRYTDWYGLGTELRFSHYHIWRWRDWIVESLNANVGYDQMVIAMLAADEVAPEDPGALRATGFLARNWDTFNRNKWLDNTIEHTAKAFLGVTLQCARCHDHKFDPIAQTEYYRFRAIFEPYQIRIERLPGQPDRAKDGLVRAFDDYLETPTRLFIRGDENQPDETTSVTAAVPASFGGGLAVHPVALPVAAYNPDKRPFVIREAREAAARAIADAQAALKTAQESLGQAITARGAAEGALASATQALASAKPEEAAGLKNTAVAATETLARAQRGAVTAEAAVRQSEARLAAAERGGTALAAVLAVEELEDAQARSARPAEWEAAARAAVAAQRQQELAEAMLAVVAARQQVEQFQTALEGLLAAATDPKEETLKPAIAKATTALVDARAGLASATQRQTTAEAAIGQPVTTDYKPRALEFPRAKVTYRDVPSNAPYAKTSTGRRLALARWITDRGNPLAARVAVNHIWTRHFGTPLVDSTFDFGLRTERPLHHDLLDWLAVEFMESGWDMRRLHRLIVTSQAYRLQSWSSEADSGNRTMDPDNRYYWKMNPRRMEAEVIRDSLLALSGKLDRTLGGPDLPTATAEEGLRRTLYYRYARDDRMLFLTMFDAASVEECYRRHETIVPQQALALSNSRLVFDRADDIARSVRAAVGGEDSAAFVVTAFERLLGRKPTDAELGAAKEGVEQLLSVENAGGESGIAPATTAAGPAPQGPVPGSARERAEAALIHVLLNHNDFVTIR